MVGTQEVPLRRCSLRPKAACALEWSIAALILEGCACDTSDLFEYVENMHTIYLQTQLEQAAQRRAFATRSSICTLDTL
jgi:hypothetical protein